MQLWISIVLAAGVSLLVAGCSPPEPVAEVYPIGIHGVSNDTDFAELREVGFSLVMAPEFAETDDGFAVTRQFLDRAASNDVRVIIRTPGYVKKTEGERPDEFLVLREFDRHEAVWAWQVAPEADLRGEWPSDIRDTILALERSLVKKPTLLSLYKGDSAGDFGGVTDMAMINRYPIPWLPLADFPRHVQLTRLGMGRDAKVLATIQAWSWASAPEGLPEETEFREPTAEEIRCMAYSALAHGANGLFFHAYELEDWRLAEHAELWEAVKVLVKEVRERQPLFGARHIWWPYSHKFKDYEGRLNAALAGSIVPALLRVDEGNDVIESGDYLLAVNTTEQRHRYSISLPREQTGLLPVLGEERKVLVQGWWLVDWFEPYEVHVYGPLRPRSE